VDGATNLPQGRDRFTVDNSCGTPAYPQGLGNAMRDKLTVDAMIARETAGLQPS
jgi:hypothetical protein